MTPIVYNPEQKIEYDFISVAKIPVFIEQCGRLPVYSEPYGTSDLCLAHDAGYVARVFDLTESNGFGTYDPMLNLSLLYSNSNVWTGVEIAKQKGVACAASQGFHHAGYRYGGGFCTFNGLVIAALKWYNENGSKVLILDGDAHWGDGTDDIIKELAIEDHVINVTPDRTEQRPWVFAQFWQWVADLIDAHRPGLIIYQAGADAWVQDPLRSGYLSREQLEWRDRAVFSAALQSSTPCVWTLAGGYSKPIQRTVDIHLATLKQCDGVYYGIKQAT